jgi:alpha-L-arabinofuranosidase
VTIVNPGLSKTMETQVGVRGGSVARVAGTVLASGDMHAHNTFDQPDAVVPTSLSVGLGDGLVNVRIPAASVVRLDLFLG